MKKKQKKRTASQRFKKEPSKSAGDALDTIDQKGLFLTLKCQDNIAGKYINIAKGQFAVSRRIGDANDEQIGVCAFKNTGVLDDFFASAIGF